MDAIPGFTALASVRDARLLARAVAEIEPDLVLQDLCLSQGSGLDLLRILDTDVMMLSAASDSAGCWTVRRRWISRLLTGPNA